MSTGHFEAKKHAYRQTQDGVVVSFVIHPNDVPADLATSPLGTPYMVGFAAIELGTNKNLAGGTASNPGSAERSRASEPPAKTHRKWDEMKLVEQAGTLCADPDFCRFLSEKYNRGQTLGDDGAAKMVRTLCEVTSRRDLDKDALSASHWQQLVHSYRAWARVQ